MTSQLQPGTTNTTTITTQQQQESFFGMSGSVAGNPIIAGAKSPASAQQADQVLPSITTMTAATPLQMQADSPPAEEHYSQYPSQQQLQQHPQQQQQQQQPQQQTQPSIKKRKLEEVMDEFAVSQRRINNSLAQSIVALSTAQKGIEDTLRQHSDYMTMTSTSAALQQQQQQQQQRRASAIPPTITKRKSNLVDKRNAQEEEVLFEVLDILASNQGDRERMTHNIRELIAERRTSLALLDRYGAEVEEEYHKQREDEDVKIDGRKLDRILLARALRLAPHIGASLLAVASSSGSSSSSEQGSMPSPSNHAGSSAPC